MVSVLLCWCFCVIYILRTLKIWLMKFIILCHNVFWSHTLVYSLTPFILHHRTATCTVGTHTHTNTHTYRIPLLLKTPSLHHPVDRYALIQFSCPTFIWTTMGFELLYDYEDLTKQTTQWRVCSQYNNM